MIVCTKYDVGNTLKLEPQFSKVEMTRMVKTNTYVLTLFVSYNFSKQEGKYENIISNNKNQKRAQYRRFYNQS